MRSTTGKWQVAKWLSLLHDLDSLVPSFNVAATLVILHCVLELLLRTNPPERQQRLHSYTMSKRFLGPDWKHLVTMCRFSGYALPPCGVGSTCTWDAKPLTEQSLRRLLADEHDPPNH